ncbi:MAG: iron ABC transporter permease [Pelosinus sp.]|nr:iron ABC transporter permease [Pelosinus sp.]
MLSDKVAGRGIGRLSVLVLFLVLLIASLIISLALGAVKMPLLDVIKILWQHPADSTSQIIWNIRLPRTLVGALVGMNLALAGAILQAVMKTPLADPHIIGVSSGAGLTGILILILFPHYEYLITPAAFVGAMGAAVVIYAMAWKGGIRPIRIVLAGVAVSAFLGAGIAGLLVFYSDRVHGALLWMVGGLSARSWPQFYTILPYSIFGLGLALFSARKLNILELGDDVAGSLGLRVEQTRFFMTAVAALLAASAVSVAGVLGFVGLIVPHAVRLVIGADYRYVLPGSALLGGVVVALSDTFARTILAPVELPVGIIMAFLGAPFFLYLLRKES